MVATWLLAGLLAEARVCGFGPATLQHKQHDVTEPDGQLSPKEESREAIIVESPTKTRTLARFLGNKYKLLATKGHVRDLPERGLAVDVDNGFKPNYVVIPRQRKTIQSLRRQLKNVTKVYLACDPDREGEAIAWHVCEVLGLEPERRARIEFNEITRRAVLEALKHPRDIDSRRVNAQQARRVLDRIVGYTLSPLLQHRLGGWKSPGQALSAGRVQSAALRLVVEREREIAQFVPEEYWRVWAGLQPSGDRRAFEAEVIERDGEKVKFSDGRQAAGAAHDLRDAQFLVADVRQKERQERPQPPFTTSTLQRAAASRLRFSARRTMQVAQQLYEGIDLPEGTVGLVTYMRTDSTRIAPEARAAAVAFIEREFGEQFVGPGARGRKARGAQEAHEAIRPTDVSRTPDALKDYLEPDQLALYRLIWQRFVASQMAPAVWDETQIDVQAGPYLLRATGKILRFPGWRAVAGAAPATRRTDDTQNGRSADEEDTDEAELPALQVGETLDLLYIRARQRFTQPPPRYTDGSLVAALERHGIGRPSTYAPIIETLRQRKYVQMRQRRFVPTPLGVAVYEWLMEYFPQIMDLEFTARMEARLDEVEQGEADWVQVLQEFYDAFTDWLRNAEDAEPRVLEGERCPMCGSPVIERFSRHGRYAACAKYPRECKYTRDLGWPIDEACPRCGGRLEVAVSRSGGLRVRCPNPDCDYVRLSEEDQQDDKSASTRTCPECGKPLVQRRGKGGRAFLGCSGYPDCTYTESLPSRRKRGSIPTELSCPQCGKPLVVRIGKRGPFIGCSGFPSCRFTRNLEAEEEQRYLSSAGGAESPGHEENTTTGDAGPAQ